MLDVMQGICSLVAHKAALRMLPQAIIIKQCTTSGGFIMGKRIASLALVIAMLLSCIPGTVWAVDNGTDIQAITRPTGLSIVENYDDYFGADWLDQLGFPETVKVTLADGSETDAAVTWNTDSLDPRKPGYYFLPGEVTLPVGATNGQNLEVSITIQVRPYENLFENHGGIPSHR